MFNEEKSENGSLQFDENEMRKRNSQVLTLIAEMEIEMSRLGRWC